MPLFDRSGPTGQGPKSGRGMGKCRDNNEVKNENSNEKGFFERALGLGLGRRGKGAGRGFGFRNR